MKLNLKSIELKEDLMYWIVNECMGLQIKELNVGKRMHEIAIVVWMYGIANKELNVWKWMHRIAIMEWMHGNEYMDCKYGFECMDLNVFHWKLVSL